MKMKSPKYVKYSIIFTQVLAVMLSGDVIEFRNNCVLDNVPKVFSKLKKIVSSLFFLKNFNLNKIYLVKENRFVKLHFL